MAAAKKTTLEIAPKKSRWAALRDEALENYEPKPPYEFDGTEPPTLVTAPESVDRLTALCELVDRKGDIDPSHMRALVKTVLGDAFDAIWAVIKDEPAEVLLPLIADINTHFDAAPRKGAASLPGGE